MCIRDSDRSYPVTPDGIACIKISGVLTKEPYWGTTAYDEIAEMCSDAMNDPSVKAVLLSINSPGGEVGGMFDLADALYAARAQKPLAAISNDSAFSAAYALASSTERIFSTRVGGTGSIGCVCAHIDYSKMLEADGINVSYVYSGSRCV